MVATVHVDLSDHAGGTVTLAPVHGCTHTLTLTGDATVTLAAAPGTVSAIRVGHPDHPLDAVWDTATTACAPGTIDTWRAPGWGGDGVHPSRLSQLRRHIHSVSYHDPR